MSHSKKIWIEVNGENSGKSFGGSDVNLTINVGASKTNTFNAGTFKVDSFEQDNTRRFVISFDGETLKDITYNLKDHSFTETN